MKRFFAGLSSLLILSLLLTASACDSRQRGENRTPASADRAPSQGSFASDDGRPEADDVDSATDAPQASALQRYTEDIEGDGPLVASIETTHGTIECELFETDTPITVANFVGLARGLKAFVDPATGDYVTDEPFYDGVIFHRVVPNFLIQAGDRSSQGHGGPGYTIPDELSEFLRHDRPGILSMANVGPNTGGSQFFITENAAPHLDGRHTVFGHCSTADVIRAISHVPTASMNRPVSPAPRIESISFSR